jgi:hypothetical protein
MFIAYVATEDTYNGARPGEVFPAGRDVHRRDQYIAALFSLQSA